MGLEANRLQRVRRLRLGWLLSLLLLTLSVLLFYLMPWPLVVRQGVVLVGIAFYAVATLLVVFARCPRCGHLFHNVLGFNNPLSPSCSHCRLSLLRK
jgi:hypothetical protein